MREKFLPILVIAGGCPLNIRPEIKGASKFKIKSERMTLTKTCMKIQHMHTLISLLYQRMDVLLSSGTHL